MRRPLIPLRILLVAAFGLQAVGVITLTLWLAWVNEQRSIAQLNERLQTQTFVRIQEKLKAYLEASSVINRLNAQDIASGKLSIDRPDQLSQQFWQLRNGLAVAPVTAMFFGSVDGRFRSLGLQGDQTWQISKADASTKGKFYSYAVNQSGRKAQLVERGKTYDPRKRLWYQQAVKNGRASWTPVYVDFKAQLLNITLSEPVYASPSDNTSDGANAQKTDLKNPVPPQIIGVVGVDITLNQLSALLKKLKTDPLSALIIVDRAGQVVSTSTDDRLSWDAAGEMERLTLSQMKDPQLRKITPQLTQILQKSAREMLTQKIQTQTQTQTLWVAPLQDQNNLDLWMVAVAPHPTFLRSLPVHSRETLLLCFVVLMTAILLSLITARRLSQSLLQMIQGGAAIANGKLDQTFPKSFIRELDQLSATFNRMANHLQQSFDELETKVQERSVALRQSEKKFTKVFYCDPNPILITRVRDGALVELNESSLQLLGFEREELLGYTLGGLDIGWPFEDYQTLVDQIQTTGSVSAKEMQIRHRSGELKTVLYSADLLELEGEPHLVSLMLDISDRRQAEEALQQAKVEAETANRAKSVFLANMSHELRTPLNAILGFAQVLQRDRTLMPNQREYVEIINRSGEHLLDMINDVLNLSKIEAGRIEIRRTSFDFGHCLKTLESMFLMKAASKGLHLIIQTEDNVPQFISTDEGKLRQILINLLGNAIKFTEAGHVQLRVHLEPAQRAASSHNGSKPLSASLNEDDPRRNLHFEIEDTGIGIAPDELDSIFEAFFQGSHSQGHAAGTGLGLPISREFVQLLGGQLSVTSRLGQGTTFAVTLPVELPTSSLRSPQTSRRVTGLSPNQPPYRLLVVDDQPESRHLMTCLLEPLGFRVREAQNGQEAVILWETWRPHLIWMDIRMPVMDGYEATRRIKAHPEGKATPIIALTASVLDEEEIILAIGCDDFVRKPFREATIFAILEKHLGLEFERAENGLDDAIAVQGVSVQAGSLSAEAFQGLSPEWIQQIHQAAQTVNNAELIRLISQLPDTHSSLAGILRRLVQNFRCDAIFQITEKLL
ncbi:MAG: ATP-binding protein [Thermosynechococcaceae cyanobacterium MS004]|nr:ATP-binding protein [Thermosynechococcaceae cyanobacterium MS004]